MRAKPTSKECRRIRIGAVNCPQKLTGMRGYSFSIGHDAVNYFQPVHVSGVLLHAADAVDHRRSEEHDDLQQQEKSGERSPIFQAIELPGSAPPAEHPMQAAKDEIQSNEQPESAIQKALPH